MFNPTIPIPKVSNKFLIAESVFFLIIGLIYYLAPESSYFWSYGFGGSMIDNFSDLLVLAPVLIFFNLLALWISLIRKINKWVIGILYVELIGIIALIPIIFTFGEAYLLLPIILVTTVFSLVFSKEITNLKIKSLFLKPFTIIVLVFLLFLVFAMLAGGGAA